MKLKNMLVAAFGGLVAIVVSEKTNFPENVLARRDNGSAIGCLIKPPANPMDNYTHLVNRFNEYPSSGNKGSYWFNRMDEIVQQATAIYENCGLQQSVDIRAELYDPFIDYVLDYVKIRIDSKPSGWANECTNYLKVLERLTQTNYPERLREISELMEKVETLANKSQP